MADFLLGGLPPIGTAPPGQTPLETGGAPPGERTAGDFPAVLAAAQSQREEAPVGRPPQNEGHSSAEPGGPPTDQGPPIGLNDTPPDHSVEADSNEETAGTLTGLSMATARAGTQASPQAAFLGEGASPAEATERVAVSVTPQGAATQGKTSPASPTVAVMAAQHSAVLAPVDSAGQTTTDTASSGESIVVEDGALESTVTSDIAAPALDEAALDEPVLGGDAVVEPAPATQAPPDSEPAVETSMGASSTEEPTPPVTTPATVADAANDAGETAEIPALPAQANAQASTARAQSNGNGIGNGVGNGVGNEVNGNGNGNGNGATVSPAETGVNVELPDAVKSQSEPGGASVDAQAGDPASDGVGDAPQGGVQRADVAVPGLATENTAPMAARAAERLTELQPTQSAQNAQTSGSAVDAPIDAEGDVAANTAPPASESGVPAPDRNGSAAPAAPAAEATLVTPSVAASTSVSASPSAAGVDAPTVQAPAGPQAASTPPGFLQAEPAANQILGSIRLLQLSGRDEVRLRLDPPELGTVRIRLIAEDGRLSVHMRVEQAVTADLLQQSLPQLRQALELSQLAFGELDVALGDSGEFGPGTPGDDHADSDDALDPFTDGDVDANESSVTEVVSDQLVDFQA